MYFYFLKMGISRFLELILNSLNKLKITYSYEKTYYGTFLRFLSIPSK
jgi:hypothetical protein